MQCSADSVVQAPVLLYPSCTPPNPVPGPSTFLVFPFSFSILTCLFGGHLNATMAGDHKGFLVPENYVDDLPNDTDMNIASIAWGLSLGISVFNIAKAIRQTQSSWQRRKKLTSYVALIWAEIISSFLLGIMCWFYLRGNIEPSMQFFFFISKYLYLQVR